MFSTINYVTKCITQMVLIHDTDIITVDCIGYNSDNIQVTLHFDKQ